MRLIPSGARQARTPASLLLGPERGSAVTDVLVTARAALWTLQSSAPYRPGRYRRAWWSRDPATLRGMEAGIEDARISAIPGDGLHDHPVIREVCRARRWLLVRGYGFIAETPDGPLRAVILLPSSSPSDAVVVCLDGTHGANVASPHRNGFDGPRGYELCLFCPPDPPDRIWEPRLGLVVLADMARAHLNREFIWRLEGYWPGDEAPHGLSEAA